MPQLPWPITWAEWRERRTGEMSGVLLHEYDRAEYLRQVGPPSPELGEFLSTEETVVNKFPQAARFVVATLFECRPQFPDLVLAFRPITWMADSQGQPIWNAEGKDWQYFGHSSDRVEIIPARTRAADSPYYAINPSGRVPYLVRDDGVGMEESALICAYLDHLDGKPALARAEQDWEAEPRAGGCRGRRGGRSRLTLCLGRTFASHVVSLLPMMQ